MTQQQGVQHLAALVAPTGPEPEDIGTGHPMREVTELVASDPAAWTPELASRVGGFFDERAGEWAAQRSDRSEVLADALARGGELRSPVVELGAGTGAGTRVLAERVDHVVAGDLAGEMLGSPNDSDATYLPDCRRPPVCIGPVSSVRQGVGRLRHQRARFIGQ